MVTVFLQQIDRFIGKAMRLVAGTENDDLWISHKRFSYSGVQV